MSTAILPQVVSDVEPLFSRLRIHFAPIVPISQNQFFEFCQQNRSYRFERTAEGDLVIMPPSGGGTGKRNLSVGAQLYNWAIADGSGTAYDSSTGFILPNGAIRSPDASWITNVRLSALSAAEQEKFIPLCPDFLVEVMSPTDSLKESLDKMEEFQANGARLGWLIDPRKKQIHVYRPGQPAQVLDDPQTLSGDPELPGFVLDLEPVWRP